MLPLLLGLGAAGLVSGYMKGKRNEKTAEENAKFRKAAIQYSPWTHMSDPGAGPQGAGGLESAISGGLQGAAMGSMVGGLGGAAAPAAGAASGAAVAPSAAPYANAFGGNDMAATLGQSGAGMQIAPIGGGDMTAGLAAGNTPSLETAFGKGKYSEMLKNLYSEQPIGG